MGEFLKVCDSVDTIEDTKQSCFERIKGRSFAFHKSTVEVFADLTAAETGLTWDSAQTALTINVLPQCATEIAITDATALTEGGDGDYTTASGVPEVTGQTSVQLTGGIYQMSAANNVKINKLNTISQDAGVSVFVLDPEANLIWGYLNSNGSVSGFPVVRNTFFLSPGGGAAGAQQIKLLQGAIPADYDEKKISFSIDDRTVRELLLQQI